MFWFEVLHLRSASSTVVKSIEDLYEQFVEILQKDNEVSIKLLKDADFFSDFMFVLEWHCKKWEFDSPPLKSTIGMKLYEKLKNYGLVTHRIFLDENGFNHT